MKNYKHLKQIENINEHYTLGEVIGKGSFGIVKKAIRHNSTDEFAIKVIEKDTIQINWVITQLMM